MPFHVIKLHLFFIASIVNQTLFCTTSLEMSICASQLVKGNVTYIKFFLIIAEIFGDISRFLVQEQISTTLGVDDPHLPVCHRCPYCKGLVCFTPPYRCLSMDETQSSTHSFTCLILGRIFHGLDYIQLCTFQLIPPPCPARFCFLTV